VFEWQLAAAERAAEHGREQRFEHAPAVHPSTLDGLHDDQAWSDLDVFEWQLAAARLGTTEHGRKQQLEHAAAVRSASGVDELHDDQARRQLDLLERQLAAARHGAGRRLDRRQLQLVWRDDRMHVAKAGNGQLDVRQRRMGAERLAAASAVPVGSARPDLGVQERQLAAARFAAAQLARRIRLPEIPGAAAAERPPFLLSGDNSSPHVQADPPIVRPAPTQSRWRWESSS
jgi:hypothetical protein